MLEAEIDAAIVASGINPFLALLAVDLDAVGGKLILPVGRGGHTWIVTPDGIRLSLSAFLELSRYTALTSARCAECGAGPLYQSLTRNTDRERGARFDARYCSNACRQRAYRKRKAGQP